MRITNKKRSASRRSLASIAICVVAASAVLLGGCSETAGMTEIVIPDDLVGWELSITVSEALNSCSAEPGTTGRFHFIDRDTIRGVRDDGSFDYPTESWSYTRTGEKSVRVRLNWISGGYEVFDLTFTSGSTGQFDARAPGDNLPCGGLHVRGTFRLDRI